MLTPLDEFESLFVGSASLDVTSSKDTDSIVMARLPPGRLIRPIRMEPPTAEGTLRACVVLDMETVDNNDELSRSWRKLWPQQQPWRTPTWKAAIAMEAREGEKAKARAALRVRAVEMTNAACRLQSGYRGRSGRLVVHGLREQRRLAALIEQEEADAAEAARREEEEATKRKAPGGKERSSKPAAGGKGSASPIGKAAADLPSPPPKAVKSKKEPASPSPGAAPIASSPAAEASTEKSAGKGTKQAKAAAEAGGGGASGGGKGGKAGGKGKGGKPDPNPNSAEAKAAASSEAKAVEQAKVTAKAEAKAAGEAAKAAAKVVAKDEEEAKAATKIQALARSKLGRKQAGVRASEAVQEAQAHAMEEALAAAANMMRSSKGIKRRGRGRSGAKVRTARAESPTIRPPGTPPGGSGKKASARGPGRAKPYAEHGGGSALMNASPMSAGQRSLAGFRSPTGADVAFGMLEAAQTVTEAQQQGYGWVTLAADGIATVTRKVTRLPAAVRQQHIQHWTRRVAVDSERERDRALIRDNLEDEKVRDKLEDEKKADAKAGERTPGLSPLGSQQYKARTERARSPPRGAALSSPYLNDIESDPKGIGFAFGGVYPGRLHARGRVVDEHKVNYSVGVVGSYLLHVRLRQPHAETTTIALQDSLPGSPFILKVVAGSAHPLSTQLPWPLVGEHERERGVFACEQVSQREHAWHGFSHSCHHHLRCSSSVALRLWPLACRPVPINLSEPVALCLAIAKPAVLASPNRCLSHETKWATDVTAAVPKLFVGLWMCHRQSRWPRPRRGRALSQRLPSSVSRGGARTVAMVHTSWSGSRAKQASLMSSSRWMVCTCSALPHNSSCHLCRSRRAVSKTAARRRRIRHLLSHRPRLPPTVARAAISPPVSSSSLPPVNCRQRASLVEPRLHPPPQTAGPRPRPPPPPLPPPRRAVMLYCARSPTAASFPTILPCGDLSSTTAAPSPWTLARSLRAEVRDERGLDTRGGACGCAQCTQGLLHATCACDAWRGNGAARLVRWTHRHLCGWVGETVSHDGDDVRRRNRMGHGEVAATPAWCHRRSLPKCAALRLLLYW